MPGDRAGADPQAGPATASRRTAATPRKLAELLRADLLTAVHPPTIDQEAVRDLCRAREDAVTDRTRARHRLAKLLLRRGIAYDGRNWTLRHRRWLLTLRFEHPAAQATFDDYLRAIARAWRSGCARWSRNWLGRVCRQRRLPRGGGVAAFALRGVDTVTAMTVLAELGDVTRFGSARQLMSYLGLTPSEYSSGARQRAGTRSHEDREQPRAPHPGGERVALPPPAAGGGSAAQAQGGPAGLGRGAGRPGADPALSPPPAAGRSRQAIGGGERGRRPRTGGLPVGGC